ncbi:hypothetical protein ASPTUDRAFT_45828 [Aspergillus tubingensis CBS 134.48]|uniref:Uncharacterized protein n=1 Tax=Aspergillus tubingensis (strain CBS 134.48) TaxID=767770 RepID=A0A1L9MZC3_ASPTC|nr:hypothetical protein ASPTUDRAFT_45828 [Aspergillus tubingensis CBS 134.48]
MVGHIDDHHSEESPLGGHWRISGWKNMRGRAASLSVWCALRYLRFSGAKMDQVCNKPKATQCSQ